MVEEQITRDDVLNGGGTNPTVKPHQQPYINPNLAPELQPVSRPITNSEQKGNPVEQWLTSQGLDPEQVADWGQLLAAGGSLALTSVPTPQTQIAGRAIGLANEGVTTYRNYKKAAEDGDVSWDELGDIGKKAAVGFGSEALGFMGPKKVAQISQLLSKVMRPQFAKFLAKNADSVTGLTGYVGEVIEDLIKNGKEPMIHKIASGNFKDVTSEELKEFLSALSGVFMQGVKQGTRRQLRNLDLDRIRSAINLAKPAPRLAFKQGGKINVRHNITRIANKLA